MLLGDPAAQMRPRFFSPLHGIIGVFFLLWGIWFRPNPMYPFLVSFGVVFLVWSLIGLALHTRRK
jgi:high-affinity Fe2+/Pb2+ permease